jgi:hypothetical protein
MVDRVGYKVEGLNELTRDLKAVGAEVEDLKGAFAAIAALGAQVAAAHAPKKSGKLAGSLRGNRSVSKAVITAGKAAVPYAGAINYGWPSRNISAAGFMQAADEELRPRAVQLLEAEVNSAIRKRGLA